MGHPASTVSPSFAWAALPSVASVHTLGEADLRRLLRQLGQHRSRPAVDPAVVAWAAEHMPGPPAAIVQALQDRVIQERQAYEGVLRKRLAVFEQAQKPALQAAFLTLANRVNRVKMSIGLGLRSPEEALAIESCPTLWHFDFARPVEVFNAYTLASVRSQMADWTSALNALEPRLTPLDPQALRSALDQVVRRDFTPPPRAEIERTRAQMETYDCPASSDDAVALIKNGFEAWRQACRVWLAEIDGPVVAASPPRSGR